MSNVPKSFKFSNIQKTLLGIAVAFWAIYKFFLKDPAVVKDMGVAYAGYLASWIMIMCGCAGFSGWELAIYVIDFVKDKVKDKLKKPSDAE